jgi:predicted RNase H-like HicB family nuclease
MLVVDATEEVPMKLKVLIHKAEEGGFWGEVPALPGCFSQGETIPDLLVNLREAIECHLDVDLPPDAEKLEVQEVEV